MHLILVTPCTPYCLPHAPHISYPMSSILASPCTLYLSATTSYWITPTNDPICFFSNYRVGNEGEVREDNYVMKWGKGWRRCLDGGEMRKFVIWGGALCPSQDAPTIYASHFHYTTSFLNLLFISAMLQAGPCLLCGQDTPGCSEYNALKPLTRVLSVFLWIDSDPFCLLDYW